MHVLVPYTPADPKSRLAVVLSAEERRTFSRLMLEDVISVTVEAGHTPTILSTEAIEYPDIRVEVDERPLSEAVNAALDPPIAVAMADLALLTPTALQEAIERPGDVVIGPGRGGGTNLLIVRDDRFAVDFHGNSLADHRRIAAGAGLYETEVDSFRVHIDVDEPADLVEVLLHGEGVAAEWLREQGFSLRTTEGRVTIERA